jgi:hypothetical protein
MIEQYQTSFKGHYPLKTTQIPPDAEITANFEISNYRCNLLATRLISMKFETSLEFTNRNKIKTQIWPSDKIQDGGGGHLGKRRGAITFEPLNRLSP